MNIFNSTKSSLLAFCGIVVAASSSLAQPALKFEITQPPSAPSYKLKGTVTMEIKVENTTPKASIGFGTPAQAAAVDAANTAYNVRVAKLLLVGTDVYGNSVTIANSDLGFAVPNGSSSLAPDKTITRTIKFTIPNDGTLYDVSGSGYRVSLQVAYDLQNGTLGGTLADSTGPDILIDVLPNLRLPTMTFPARTDHRGGEVVNFTAYIYNDLAGEGSLAGRPLRPVTGDKYRLNTYLTTDPQIGGSNSDDYLLNFMDLFGDAGGAVVNSESIVRRVRTVGTPGRLPAYGDPTDPSTQRNYTPQPDDGFLDLGETVVLDYEVLVPQNYRGTYFVAGFVDALNGVGEPTNYSPSKESDVVPCDNQYVSSPAVRFGIQATEAPDIDIVSGSINQNTGALSVAGNDDSDLPSLSRKGEVIAFSSNATNLDSTGVTTNGRRHIYAKVTNLRTGAVTTKLISRSSAGVLANNDCTDPVVSGNGRFIAFSSTASNLVDKDSNNLSDIFVYDLLLGKMSRVSLTSAGLQSNGASFAPSISADGRFVAFHSRATNLRPSGTLTGGGIAQVFVVDRDKDVNGTFDEIAANKIATYLVSVDKRGVRADALTYLAKISGDGKFVAFVSHATNLDSASSVTASGKGTYGRLPFSSIYRIGLNNGAPVPSSLDVVSVPDAALMPGLKTDAASYELAINADGKHIAFTSQGTNLVPDDTNAVGDVFVRDYSETSPKTVRVSTSAERSATGVLTVLGTISPVLPPDNIPADNISAGDSVTIDDGVSLPPAVFTAGGNWAVGASAAASRDKLVLALTTARSSGLEIEAKATTPSSRITGFLSSSTAFYPSIELYNLVPGAQGNTAGSLPAPPASISFSGMSGGGTQADDPEQDASIPAEDLLGVPSGSNLPSIDDSGRYVAYRSVAANLDVYTPNPDEALPPARNVLRAGERIRPLVNRSSNVYVHDRNVSGMTDPDSGVQIFDKQGNSASTRVSVNKFGYPTLFLLNAWSSANSHSPAISGNGTKIAFASDSENNSGIIFGRNNQSPLDLNQRRDVFSYTRGDLLDEADATEALDAQVIAFDPFQSPVRFDQLLRFGQLAKVTLKAFASSGLPVTFTSSNPQVAYVSGNTLNIVKVGTAIITASQTGDGQNWLAAPNVTQTLVVAKGLQEVACPQPPSLRVGESLQLQGSSSSGLPVAYKSLNTAVATVSSSGVLSGVSNGTVDIQAIQAGDGNWEAATPVTLKVQVSYSQPARIVFVLSQADKMRSLTPTTQTITLKATSSNTSVPVYYESSNPAVVSVKGNIATIITPGTADIYAKQDATEDYPASVTVKQTVVVSKGSPGALAAIPATAKIGEVSEISLQATDAFGRALTHTSSNPAVAKVVGNKLQILAPGTVAIRSFVAADANVAGIDVVRNLTVIAGEQKIAWLAPTAMIDGSLKPSPAPRTTTLGVVVAYTSDNPAAVRVSGNAITIIGKGFANVTATAPATSTFAAAAPVTYRIGRPY